MNKIIYLLAYITIACSTATTITMEKMNLFVIPHSKSDGTDYVSNIFSEDQYHISNIGTPFTLTFPYQTKKHYEGTIEQAINKVHNKSFLYALGDGVPFAFDYAAKNPDKVAGILAEETILTEQHYPFNTCTRISKDIPIIFVHNSNDSVSPCKNIIALFHHLNSNTPRKDNYHRTACLSFVGPHTTENDHKDLKNTAVLKKIHVFLHLNNLYNKHAQLKEKTSDVEVTSHTNLPNQEEHKHMNNLIKEENRRYYRDWATIIVPTSLFAAMLAWLLYKSGATEKLSNYLSR